MPKVILMAALVEVVLIFGTTLLLVQPDFLFRNGSPSLRTVARFSGYSLLCLTFCWSFYLGSIFTLQSLTLRI